MEPLLPTANPALRTHQMGDVIGGKYRLIEVLGEGGMGSIWLARNLILDAEVAIKLLRSHVVSTEASQRLLQEARAAARLKHPSIVRVFDFGETDQGEPFLVMELLHGQSLAEMLFHKGRLPSADAAKLLLPVASALATAHTKGVVHRDLKPDNIFLVRDDNNALVPKVVDFGIAKFAASEFNGQITQAGIVLGSPDYMSPEQARGQADVDSRSDVWAFTVVFYESITGRRPFEGANYNALLTSIIMDAPVATTEYAAGDADLWAILQRGFSKDPTTRWQSLRDMGEALAEWAIARGIDTDSTGSSLVAHWRAGKPLSSPQHTSINRITTPPPPFDEQTTRYPDTPSSITNHSLPNAPQSPSSEERIPLLLDAHPRGTISLPTPLASPGPPDLPRRPSTWWLLAVTIGASLLGVALYQNYLPKPLRPDQQGHASPASFEGTAELLPFSVSANADLQASNPSGALAAPRSSFSSSDTATSASSLAASASAQQHILTKASAPPLLRLRAPAGPSTPPAKAPSASSDRPMPIPTDPHF